MESQKMIEDEIFSNLEYSKIIGISCEDLLFIEYNFLVMLDFNLYIKEKEFYDYKAKFTTFLKL